MNEQDAHRKTSDVRCRRERDEAEAVKLWSRRANRNRVTAVRSAVCGLEWMVATRVPCVVGITINYTRWPENLMMQFADNGSV